MLASAARAALRASVVRVCCVCVQGRGTATHPTPRRDRPIDPPLPPCPLQAAATRSAWPHAAPHVATPHTRVRPLVPCFTATAFTRAASSSASTAAAKAAGLKAYRPTTPGFRGRIITARDGLWSGRPHKPLTVGLRRTGGRNAAGRVTVRHRGGGHRKVYRVIDFWRRGGGGRDGGSDAGAAPRTARVERIEYDPNRTARIALLAPEAAGDDTDPAITSTDGRSYILAPAGLAVGDTVASGRGAPITPGCCLRLADMPVGTPVHNVELLPGKGGQMARAAGTAAVVVSRGEEREGGLVEAFCLFLFSDTHTPAPSPHPSGGPDGYAIVRLPSGAQRRVLATCRATVGSLSNPGHKNRSLGKAGAARWAGRRPKVRGVAMNSVDHPMGGGRGKSKGRISQSPTGVPAKGKKTRALRNRTDVFVHVARPRARR